MTSLVLVKIGGSLITDKNKPFSLRESALKTISEEVKKATDLGKQLIIGHGAGSFAHVPAKKYQTHKGISGQESYRGIAEVADAAARLNRIVVAALLEAGVNAVSISPLTMMTTRNHELETLCLDSLKRALDLGLVPVVYGDQLLDHAIGCTIYSTEKVLGHVGLGLMHEGYVVERIIHCGQTNGVYDADGKTIELITGETIDTYRSAIAGSHGTDVTGGMIHKVEETLAMARQGIPGMIIDGIEHGSLSEAIAGKPVLGTRIEA